jgi:hypothetical protein
MKYGGGWEIENWLPDFINGPPLKRRATAVFVARVFRPGVFLLKLVGGQLWALANTR